VELAMVVVVVDTDQAVIIMALTIGVVPEVVLEDIQAMVDKVVTIVLALEPYPGPQEPVEQVVVAGQDLV